MKLELIGHDEKYAVEQSLLTLFPDERPVYGPASASPPSCAAAAKPPPTATAIPSPARTTKRKGSAVTRWA